MTFTIKFPNLELFTKIAKYFEEHFQNIEIFKNQNFCVINNF